MCNTQHCQTFLHNSHEATCHKISMYVHRVYYMGHCLWLYFYLSIPNKLWLLIIQNVQVQVQETNKQNSFIRPVLCCTGDNQISGCFMHQFSNNLMCKTTSTSTIQPLLYIWNYNDQVSLCYIRLFFLNDVMFWHHDSTLKLWHARTAVTGNPRKSTMREWKLQPLNL